MRPALYGDGEPAARMLEAALDGLDGHGIVRAMLGRFAAWSAATTLAHGRSELTYAERNADFLERRFRA